MTDPSVVREPAGSAEELEELAAAFAAGQPVPLAAGTFAIYQDGKGGYVLVTHIDGQPEPDRRHLPATLVKMATRGPLGKSLGKLLGG